MNFLQTINQNISKLTNSEKKLIRYITTHSDQVIYDTVKSLGEATQTGDATIIRLCKKLGFSGFSEFKIALAKASMSTKPESGNRKHDYDDSAQLLVNAIDKTKNLIDERALQTAVRLLTKADRVYVFGVGHSGESARDYVKTWLRIGLIAQAETDPHIQTQISSLLSPKDTVIALSLSGHTKDIYESVKLAKTNGARVITISNDLTSPIASLGDARLQTAVSEFNTVGSVSGQVSQLYLCDVLARGYEKMAGVDTDALKERALKALMKKAI